MVERNIIIGAATLKGGLHYNWLTGQGNAGTFATELFLSHEATLVPRNQAQPSARELNSQSDFIGDLARAWERNPRILDRLSEDLARDPALKTRFQQSMIRDRTDGNLNTTRANFAAYAENPTIETLRNRFPAPAAAAPAAPRQETPRRETSAPTTPRRIDPAPSSRQDTPQREPAAAALSSAPVSPVAQTGDIEAITADTAGIIASGLVGKMHTIFGEEFASEEATLMTRLQGDPDLRQRLANAVNADAELTAQLNGTPRPGDGKGIDQMLEEYGDQSAEVQAGVRDRIRPFYRQILEDPTKFADPAFRERMGNSATQGGIMATIQDIINQVMEFLGIGNGSGGNNIMSMFSGDARGGSLIDGLVDRGAEMLRGRAFHAEFDEGGPSSRYGLTRVVDGVAQLPEFRRKEQDGTYTRVNADGTAIQPPAEQPQVRMASNPPADASQNSQTALNNNGPIAGPSGGSAAAGPLAG